MNYPSPRPKRLQKSPHDRWIGGVCGGIAEYLNMDPTLVRVLVIVLAVVTAAFPVALVYFLLMMLLPEGRQLPPSSIGPHQQPYGSQFQYGAEQFGSGQYTWSAGRQSAPAPDPVWGPEGAPWQQQPAGTSAESPAPRINTEDLFSRAKHPTKPTGKLSDPGTGPADSGSTNGSTAGADSDPGR